MLLPALSRAKMKALRIADLNNTKQHGLGSQLYAQDDDKNALTGVANYGDDDLNWLYPYMRAGKSFVCPATKNTVPTTNELAVTATTVPTYGGTVVDGVPASYSERLHGSSTYLTYLMDNAGGKNAPLGHSYEVAGFFRGANGTSTANGFNTRKTQNSIANYTYRQAQLGTKYNFLGQKASPSDVWITYDADDPGGTGSDRPNQDYPDPGDNHGTEGGCVAFADGHAEWVKQSKYVRSFILGTDESHALAATK